MKLSFVERVGEIAGIILIVGLVWVGASTVIRWWSDLPPVCASIGGGCR